MNILAHKIKIIVTPAQETALNKACGVSRYTYNWALAQSTAYYAATGKFCKLSDLKKVWNQCKPAWVLESPRDANSQPFADLQKAYTNFFCELKKGNKKAGRPVFKKKGKCRDGFYLANDAFWCKGLIAKLPVIGKVELTEELRFSGKILRGNISREANCWFLSVTVEGDFLRERTGDGIIGVDLGVKVLATLSTGETIAGPKPLRSALKKLARLQRQHSRKQKGSKNKAKAAMKVAQMHYRIKNIRVDALHKLTNNLCRENQTVVIEDLNVSGMLKNHKLARAISDMGFSVFRKQLEYKAKLYNTQIVLADRWFPSSKTCSQCGCIKESLLLSERTYTCEQCGMSLDRDLNAALNLKALGLRVLACGLESSGSALGASETNQVEAGIGLAPLCAFQKQSAFAPPHKAGQTIYKVL